MPSLCVTTWCHNSVITFFVARYSVWFQKFYSQLVYSVLTLYSSSCHCSSSFKSLFLWRNDIACSPYSYITRHFKHNLPFLQRMVFPTLLASLLRTQLAMEPSVMLLTSQMSLVSFVAIQSMIICCCRIVNSLQTSVFRQSATLLVYKGQPYPCSQASLLRNLNVEVVLAGRAWYFFLREQHQR